MRDTKLLDLLIPLLTLFVILTHLVGCAPTREVVKEPVFVGPDLRKPPMQLVMMHNHQCYACQRFIAEVSEEYDTRREGFFLPLVVRNIYAPATQKWYAKGLEEGRLNKVNRTPAFIVLEGELDTGVEIANFIGYEDKDDFYKQVGFMIDMYELDDPQKRKVFAQ